MNEKKLHRIRFHQKVLVRYRNNINKMIKYNNDLDYYTTNVHTLNYFTKKMSKLAYKIRLHQTNLIMGLEALNVLSTKLATYYNTIECSIEENREVSKKNMTSLHDTVMEYGVQLDAIELSIVHAKKKIRKLRDVIGELDAKNT